MKVSWQVTGVRQDAYAKAHPLVVEEAKPAGEQGYYIHPELFGAPPERSTDWAQSHAHLTGTAGGKPAALKSVKPK